MQHILNTLLLIKSLHESPFAGATLPDGYEYERVRLAPKTLEQLDAAIAECNTLIRNYENNPDNLRERLFKHD